MSCVVNGASQPDTPDVWLRMCRTSMRSLPFSTNSGQYLGTGEYGSSWPRSTSIRAARLGTVLGADQALVIVFSAHGLPRIAPPATDSYDSPPVDVHHDARAGLVTGFELPGERVPHRLEFRVAGSVHIHHRGQPFLIERPDSASSSSPIRTVGEINNGPFAELSHERRRDAR